MIRMLVTLFFSLLVLLSSCELMIPDRNDHDIWLMTVALDYRDTDLNVLNGTVNDQDAMNAQIEMLCQEERRDLHSVMLTSRGGRVYRKSLEYDGKTGGIIEKQSDFLLATMKDRILDELVHIGKSINYDDIFIFFYAGHGADSLSKNLRHYNGALVVGNIVFPELGDWRTEPDNQSSMILLSELTNKLDQISAYKVVILDSCYSGALHSGSGSLSGTDEIVSCIKGLFYKGSSGNNRTYLLMASGDDEMSFEDDRYGLHHGLFSTQILSRLGYVFSQDGYEHTGLPSQGIVTVTGLYDRIEEDILTYQKPEMNRFFTDLVLFTLPSRSRF